VYRLKSEIDQPVKTKDSAGTFIPEPVHRIKVAEHLAVRSVFDVAERTADEKSQDIVKTEESVSEIQNQLKDLRVKGIIVSDGSTYAVLAFMEKNRETETKKVFENERFHGYTLARIYPGHVEMENHNMEKIKLGVFKTYKE
jgi:hypothetical protein